MSTLQEFKQALETLQAEIDDRLSKLGDAEQLEQFRVAYLGRKGKLTDLLKGLGKLDPADRGEAGKLVNELKQRATTAVEAGAVAAAAARIEARLHSEAVDMSLPGVSYGNGRLHPLTQVQQEIESIFMRMGFDVATGPEIETDYYNFEALNIPAGHPARADWDTFYITDDTLLRPHTSPVQVRTMENTKPPVRIICPGRCYRRDAQDATHSPVFHQVELLWIEAGLTLANLKYVLEVFIEEFFGEGYDMLFSGDFFPFTEPSVQVHIRAPEAEKWMEIMGAGEVDPAVLMAVGYDPEEVSGFAFGLGLERMAMLKYGIPDIRAFLANDLRFLKQFPVGS